MSWTITGRPGRSTSRAPRGATTPLDLAIAAENVPARLRPALLAGYQTVRPLPPGYAEHQDVLLAGRTLFLAIWHLANGFAADDYLAELRRLA